MGRQKFLLATHQEVKWSGTFNHLGCKIVLPSNFNFPYIEQELVPYEDHDIIELLKYGFPVDCQVSPINPGLPPNHKGATDFPLEIQTQLRKEILLGGALGPFEIPPFATPRFSPLNSVPKKDSSDRRLILDLSFPRGKSINDGINKDIYLGKYSKLEPPTIDKLVEKIVELGKGSKIFKVDLSRSYKQFFINPLDFPLMGFAFDGKFYFNCTLSMGSRSSARCYQRVTSAVVHIFTNYGHFAINYLDDLGGVESAA